MAEALHEAIHEPVPNDLPEPMQRITCSCGGFKAIGLSSGECNAKFAVHLSQVGAS